MPKAKAKKIDGRYRFMVGGVSKSIEIGPLPESTSKEYRLNLDELVEAVRRNIQLSGRCQEWLRGIDAALHAKIAKAGLCKGRSTTTLIGLIDGFLERRKQTVKKSTMTVYQQARKKMLAFFGEGRNPQTITIGEAHDFVANLRNLVAEATVDRVMRQVRTFFNEAVELELTEKNVFKKIRTSGTPNADRNVPIPAELIDNIIENGCPNAEWQLLLALLRYGGMRMPSETMLLRWQDVDFTGEMNWLGNNTPAIRFRSEKTQHHNGGGMRTIPIFDKILPHLEDVAEIATARATASGEREAYVFWKIVPKAIRLNETERVRKNFRTWFQKILKRMGITPWDKLFQNLRRACRNDLERCGAFTPKAIDSMMGHSSDVAARHYSDVLPSDFSNGVSKVFVRDKTESTTSVLMREPQGLEIAKGIATHGIRQICETTGRSETSQNTVYHASDNKENTAKQPIMGAHGLEHSTKTPCVAVSGKNEIAKGIAEFPQNLQTVIDGWPFLTQKEQQRITQFVNSRSLAPVK